MVGNTSTGKEVKPQSTASQKLTALASIYSAAKLNSLVKANEQILAAQQQSTVVLENIDGELLKLNRLSKNVESLQSSTLSELQKKNERDRIRDAITDYRYQIDELRREQERLEERELQCTKDSVHAINRESKLLLRSEFSNLEKLFLIDAMRDSLSLVTAKNFKEISDMQFLADTNDLLSDVRRQVESALSKQEIKDYDYCVKIKKSLLLDQLRSTHNKIKTLQKKMKAIKSLEEIIQGKSSLSDKQLSSAIKQLKTLDN
jgi:hypothetical protein